MKRAIAVAAAIAALAGTFAIGWAASSSGSSPANATSTNASAVLSAALTGTSSGTSAADGAALKQRYESFISAVAAKAGVSPSTLDSAVRSVIVSRIEAAAKAGKINPTVATKVEQAINDGNLADLLAQRVQAMRARGIAHPGLRLFARIHRWLR